MASIEPAGAGVYEIGNDQVPEAYRDFFDNADWTQHTLMVYGSWVFFISRRPRTRLRVGLASVVGERYD